MANFGNLRELPAQFFEQAIKALVCLLLLALLGAIGAGVARAFLDLGFCFRQLLAAEMHSAWKPVLVDVLAVLAIVEVFRTALAYLTEGRVKVTYIIDTVLVAVLTEVVAFWYKEIEADRLVMVIALVLALMVVRIAAIRFSPRRVELSEGL